MCVCVCETERERERERERLGSGYSEKYRNGKPVWSTNYLVSLSLPVMKCAGSVSLSERPIRIPPVCSSIAMRGSCFDFSGRYNPVSYFATLCRD